MLVAAACAGPKFDPAKVADADATQVAHVEPLSWWTGMKTPLQLLVNGENISAHDTKIEIRGIAQLQWKCSTERRGSHITATMTLIIRS